MISGYEQAFFLHIPKTGGESFATLLREDVDLGEVLRLPSDEGFFPALDTANRYRVVHGHAPYSLASVLAEPLFVITLLRSPVERVVSQFEYVRRSDLPQHREQRAALRQHGIAEILDLIESGRGSNLQTRMLGADLDVRPLLEQFRRGELSAERARRQLQRGRRGQPPAELLERAKHRLERIQFIGLTEAFEASVRLFAEAVGMSTVPSVQRTNIAPPRQRAARMHRYDASTLAAIADANSVDQKLYRFAVDLFERRYREAFGERPAIEPPALVAPRAASNGRAMASVTRPGGARGRGRPPRSPRAERGGRPGATGQPGGLAGYRQAYFLHIPKTGGESVAHWLAAQEPLGAVGRLPVTEELFPALIAAERYRVVHGHAGYPVTAALTEPLFVITFLRSPVERLVSWFEYVRRSEHPRHRELRERWQEKRIDAISELIRRGNSSNLQTRLLGADYDIRPLVARFRSGELTAAEARTEARAQERGKPDRTTLERAKARLEEIEFVGVTEAFEESVRLLGSRLDVGGSPATERRNAAPAGERRERADRYSDADLAAIAADNALDLELHEFALALFRGRYEEAFGTAPGAGA